MTLRQKDLLRLSEHYFCAADTIAGKDLKRYLPRMTDLGMTDEGEIRWTSPHNGEVPLNGLGMLARLAAMETFRASAHNLTRRNTVTVARVGGAALHHIHALAHGRGVELSEGALQGIAHTTGVVHDRLEETFTPMARMHHTDREAMYFLARAGEILGRR